MINQPQNSPPHLRIVSRKSALALWQAEFVKQQLQNIHPGLTINIIGIQTEGDKFQNTSLAKLGGKGLFVKELEEHLLSNQADIAIHSLKDMPTLLPKGLKLAAILKREEAEDAFVSNCASSVLTLPQASRVGTSSLRRQSQLLAIRQDLRPIVLRGNVDTRIQKLDRENSDYDAIILAVAGLVRLNLKHRIAEIFPPNIMLPAVGQGALGIECRTEDDFIQKLIAPLHHQATAYCISAERAMNAALGGGCQLPIAGFASITTEGYLKLQGLVATPNGHTLLKATAVGKRKEALILGKKVAQVLIAQGAQKIIDAC